MTGPYPIILHIRVYSHLREGASYHLGTRSHYSSYSVCYSRSADPLCTNMAYAISYNITEADDGAIIVTFFIIRVHIQYILV